MEQEISRHHGGWGNVIAGYVLAMLAGIVGIGLTGLSVHGLWNANFSLPFYREQGWCWFAVVGILVVAAIFFFITYFLFLVSTTIFQRTVTLYENGFSIREGSEIREVFWYELSGVTEVKLREVIPVLQFPFSLLLPRWESKRFDLSVRGEEAPFSFDRNFVSDLAGFERTLKQICDRYSIPIEHRVEE